MQITIEKDRASSILVDNKFYDAGRPIEVSFSEAYRLSQVAKTQVSFERTAYDSELFSRDKFFNFYGDVDASSGFGGVSMALVKYSRPEFNIALGGRTMDVQDPVILSARRRELQQAGAMVWHDQPRDSWLQSPFERNLCIVPFETTIIPKSWIHKINNFDALMVPCEQNIEAFRSSGVTIPIERISWGVDTSKWTPIDRPERSTFTFGTMGALSIRKGTDVLVEAFTEAFPTEQDVRLVCKTSYMQYPFMTADKRIKIQMSPVSHEDLMNDFCREIDCFVFPTRGEGVGLPPLEMAATGVPVIVTNWSGPADYMHEDIGWKLDYSMTPAKNFTEEVYKEECGDWAEPNKAHLIGLMRYCYEHRKEVREKGKTAAEYIQREWQWKDRILEYHAALRKHL